MTPNLTPREREFIDILLAQDGKPVYLAEIALLMCGDRSAVAAVRVIASRVRDKWPNLKIDVVRGVGYVINAERCPSCEGTGWKIRTKDDVAADIEELVRKDG